MCSSDLSIPCLSPHPQRIDLRRLRLHRHTQCERGQHSDDGNEPDGVRHAGLSAQDDVMSDPILPLASGGFFRITPVRKVIVSDPLYLLEPSLDIEMTGPRVLIYGKKRVTLASEAVRTRQASDSRRNESGRRFVGPASHKQCPAPAGPRSWF